jgi:ubiquinone biosynthesis protein
MRTRSAAARVAERREVENCLSRRGLLRRPRPVAGAAAAASPGSAPAAEPFGRRLSGALQELGPVFAAFGLYLGSRVDLLAAADCLELSAPPDRVPPLPQEAMRAAIAAELADRADAAGAGEPGAASFATISAIELEPCESRLLVQGHRARLADGQPVLLRLVRPGAAEAAEADLERLPLLAGAFAEHGWSSGWLDEAIAGFWRSLRDEADLAAAAGALELLALDAESFGLLAAPEVHRDLCTPRLLVVGDPGGTDLALAIAEARAGRDAPRRRELARLVCVAWVHQALAGRVFPVGLAETGARVLAGGRLALLGGSFARPPAVDQANLRGFLVAMAVREPDDACSYLLREMTPEGPEAAEETLRLQWRQVVPFRDGAWTAAGTSLAEHVFVCARHARGCGFRPRSQLLAFYRGLAAAATAARRLAPEEPEHPRRPGDPRDSEPPHPPQLPQLPQDDALLEAVNEVRVLTGFSQVRDAMSPPWTDQMGRYAALLSELPRKMDELLAMAAESDPRSARAAAERPVRREESSHLLVAGALLVLGALVLILHHFVQLGALVGRGETIAAMLLLAVGGTLVWSLARIR